MAGTRNTTPAKVIEVAVGIADSEGFEAVTLARVAQALGIRVPSLYNHVAGLYGLQTMLRLWGLRQLTTAIQKAAVGKSGEDALIAIAHAYRGFAHAHPGIYPQTLRAAGSDEPTMVEAANELLGVLITVLQHYPLSDDDRLHVIRVLRSVLHGFVDLEVAGGFELPLDRDESFQRLLDVFISGLRSQYGSFREG
jgi:AcrR family transcriptional regulator